MTTTFTTTQLARRERKAKYKADDEREWRECARKALHKNFEDSRNDDERRDVEKNLRDLDAACLAAGDEPYTPN